MNEEAKYRIDGDPVTAHQLIEYAAQEYGYNSQIRQTSIAASILREHDHTVDDNPDYP